MSLARSPTDEDTRRRRPVRFRNSFRRLASRNRAYNPDDPAHHLRDSNPLLPRHHHDSCTGAGHTHPDHEHEKSPTGGHAHAGGHAHGASSRRRLTAALVLTSVYLFAEGIGGWWTGSLSLLADAGHMLTDAASLALALFASWLAGRPPNARRTFGYHRAEILAALVNGATLLAACIGIVVEAVERFRAPQPVFAPGMLAIACGGLVVNVLAITVLHSGRGESLNLRGAWLHVVGDALGSVGAILAAMLVWAFGWLWADPAASILIAVLILLSSGRLLAEAVGVLMESAPRGIDVDLVQAAIAATPGVAGLHDLHVWSITTSRVCLSVHVIAASGEDPTAILRRVTTTLAERFGIDHTTIQVEPADADCDTDCRPG